MAAALDGTFRGRRLLSVREEAVDRYRLVLDLGERTGSIDLSLRPELPWIGRCPGRKRPARAPGPFAARAARVLEGRILEGVVKDRDDRVVRLLFAGGPALVAELATHRANLVLLDEAGAVVASARHPRRAAERLAPGTVYRPPDLPAGLAVPGRDGEEAVRAAIRAALEEGESLVEAIRRRVFGVGTAGAELIAAEGGDPAAALSAHLAALDPAVRDGRLVPWGEGARESDPAWTAGTWHDAREREQDARARERALRGILDREIRRAWDAEAAARADETSFGDPDRHRRLAEALLAGLSSARRAGDEAFVPDPYDPEGRTVAVPAPAGMPLPAAAEEMFRRSRRARRGIEGARRRAADLAARRERLDALREAPPERLEAGMRAEGIPVGLSAGTRAAREAAAAAPPRVEGVRLIRGTGGAVLLAGKTGRDNARLTFKLAAPEDFWFHALGVPGAHVVLRNPARAGRPDARALQEAAAAAAWFSDARSQAWVDVQWARRKDVRPLRGAPPGTVVLKRSETVRVRPGLPPGAC